MPERMLKPGDPIAFEYEDGRRQIVYVKDWRSVNGVTTITTVARPEYVEDEAA